MQVSRPSRHRSPSDPFNDSYSYQVPTLSRNAPAQPSSRAPPVPPKGATPTKTTPSRRAHPSISNRDNVVEAVRDTVQLRHDSPRARMGRSNTEIAPPSSSRPPPATRRSLSQDSVARTANAVEKSKPGGRGRGAKKGSSHADVIDRLDFSGVGPMFHHDGPFDACAPSRNRHRTKAPMLAWSGAHEADREALGKAQEVQTPYESGPYPAPGAVYVPYEEPKKKNHDAIAEAWGIHEPEPFEDFSAGGGPSSRRSGEQSRMVSQPRGMGGVRRPKDRAREPHREHLDDPQRPGNARQTSKRALPPPQPIFVPEGEALPQEQSPPSPGSPGQPKRNKSIMRRIRRMRDNPNVPVGADDGTEEEGSPTSSTENSAATYPAARPTHRSQNSFLGRFGRGANVGKADDVTTEDVGSYVYVDPVPINKEKSLPATPGRKEYYADVSPGENNVGYFEAGSPTGGAGLGRKTSLLKKVKGVVRGTSRG